MSECVLITGATGNQGTASISGLLAYRGVRVIGMVRARDQEPLAERRRKLLKVLGEGIDSERLVAKAAGQARYPCGCGSFGLRLGGHCPLAR